MPSVDGQLQDAASDSGSVQAAVARSLTRGLGLYFSRPVRLFRPVKISGWHALQRLAQHDGYTFSPKYIYSLIQKQGVGVIPKHFIPPMAVNAFLGTVLWTTYGETFDFIEPRLNGHTIVASALSGMIAGAAQAVCAAPAENVRLVLEGGTRYRTWSHAWQEVFRFTPTSTSFSIPKERKLEEIRQLRAWMHEVGGMAGNGWQGWGWGCAKDMCGFGTFFAIFDLTRRIAVHSKAASSRLAGMGVEHRVIDASFGDFFPRVVHAVTLVSGGVAAGLAYEYVCLPWDNARRLVYLERAAASRDTPQISTLAVLTKELDERGPWGFFQQATVPRESKPITLKRYVKVYAALRTIARAGPWGIGFLVWEAYGAGV